MPSTLSELQQEWIDLYAKMNRKDDFKRKMAAPFLSVEPENYRPETLPSVLVVGKATRGDWDERKEALGSCEDRRNETALFIREDIMHGKGMWAFFRFATDCASIAAKFSSDNVEACQNLVWSNLAKIGTISGNPNGRYFNFQERLAVETLREEIRFYRPDLVLLTTGEYQEEAIYNATVPRDRWRMENQNMSYWWRPAGDGLPALLWTYHPQGKRADILCAWKARVEYLIRMSRTAEQRRTL